ncbi:rod shape-determining protein MreD [Siccirubricoccus sp. KC 17139]|uniref:Rod shape-determining protein MreD n=1 Tax=Siccirubricoccus soli TaxID=2899147 RepID=A0ABT1D356_9PROT|nr:rod shape-determining protein MreD [Siccirubricoccus soli]MCO6416042.1 rod shape-determining protein MreD [Siccirubricoccus soli]MCP2682174.1 rod shape-determining protein MreD [Siccirubricoccus soli]
MAFKGRPAPSTGLLRQVDALARAAFPSGFTVLVLVLAAVPVGLPGVVAAAGLPCIFFWSVFRPAALPPPAIFGLGLLTDLLSAAPLGSNILILLVVYGFATRWRRFLARQSFLAVWLAFCGFAAVAALLGWGLQALLGWAVPPAMPGVAQVMLSAGLYPMLAALMSAAQQAMIRAEAAG